MIIVEKLEKNKEHHHHEEEDGPDFHLLYAQAVERAQKEEAPEKRVCFSIIAS